MAIVVVWYLRKKCLQSSNKCQAPSRTRTEVYDSAVLGVLCPHASLNEADPDDLGAMLQQGRLQAVLARLATPRTVVLVAYDEALARWEAYRRFEEQAPRDFEVEAVVDGDDADAEAPPALSKPTVRLFRLRRREG